MPIPQGRFPSRLTRRWICAADSFWSDTRCASNRSDDPRKTYPPDAAQRAFVPHVLRLQDSSGGYGLLLHVGQNPSLPECPA